MEGYCFYSHEGGKTKGYVRFDCPNSVAYLEVLTSRKRICIRHCHPSHCLPSYGDLAFPRPHSQVASIELAVSKPISVVSARTLCESFQVHLKEPRLVSQEAS